MTMRLASRDDLQTITTLTAAAYLPYTELFGAPPVPVTEDYAPRIERGEVWLRSKQVAQRVADHLVLGHLDAVPLRQRVHQRRRARRAPSSHG